MNGWRKEEKNSLVQIKCMYFPMPIPHWLSAIALKCLFSHTNPLLEPMVWITNVSLNPGI